MFNKRIFSNTVFYRMGGGGGVQTVQNGVKLNTILDSSVATATEMWSVSSSSRHSSFRHTHKGEQTEAYENLYHIFVYNGGKKENVLNVFKRKLSIVWYIHVSEYHTCEGVVTA